MRARVDLLIYAPILPARAEMRQVYSKARKSRALWARLIGGCLSPHCRDAPAVVAVQVNAALRNGDAIARSGDDVLEPNVSASAALNLFAQSGCQGCRIDSAYSSASRSVANDATDLGTDIVDLHIETV